MPSISVTSSTPDQARNTTVQSPTSPTSSTRLSWNTGFPEPLSLDRNTTLRFPGADTSPTACIEDNDVPVGRTQSRRLRISSRRSKSGSHGYLAPEEISAVSSVGAMYEDLAPVDETQGYLSEESGHSILKDGTGNVLKDSTGRKSSGSENGSVGSKKERNRRSLLGIFHHHPKN